MKFDKTDKACLEWYEAEVIKLAKERNFKLTAARKKCIHDFLFDHINGFCHFKGKDPWFDAKYLIRDVFNRNGYTLHVNIRLGTPTQYILLEVIS